MKNWTIGLVVTSCILAFIQSAQAFPITVKHKQGSTVVQTTPQRVAVFDLATLDTMNALGVSASGVPDTFMPKYLSYYSEERYTKVGDLFKPDYDALKDFKPDLIIVASRSARAYEELSKLAPTLDLSIDASNFVEGVEQNVELLGKVFNRQEKAQQLISMLNKKMDILHTKSSEHTALVLFTVKGHVMLHAPGERFGMLYELTGNQPVVPKVTPSAQKNRAKPGSEEAAKQQAERQQRLDSALAKNPDWLFVLDRGAATGGEGQATNTLVNMPDVVSTNAWQKEQVYYLHPREWYLALGGYQSVSNTLDDLNHRFAD